MKLLISAAIAYAVIVGVGLTLDRIGTVSAQSAPMVLTLTSQEQMQLDNMRLKRRAMDAEYNAARLTLILEERQYEAQVLSAHPGAAARFDEDSISWVKIVGAAGASGASGK